MGREINPNTLPYSQIMLPSPDSSPTDEANTDEGDLAKDIVSQLQFVSQGYVIRSPFVALSSPSKGRIDDFFSSQELAQTVRSGVTLRAKYLSICDQHNIR